MAAESPQSVSLDNPAPLLSGYQIEEEVGRSSLGVIYRAHRTSDGVPVAVRYFPHPAGVDTTRWNETLRNIREALEAQRPLANHPHVETVLGFGGSEDDFYVVTEWLTGMTLRQMLQPGVPCSIEWALPIFSQVALAVDFAASLGLSHTDLSPENISLIEPDGQVRIRNFGLGHVRRKLGSVYLAPEQVAGSAGNALSDIYSVGAILYECLSGQPPYSGESVEAICRKIQAGPPPVLRNQPEYVQNIVARMMMTSPEQRYKVLVDVIEDLRAHRSPPALKVTKTTIRKIEEIGSGMDPVSATTDVDTEYAIINARPVTRRELFLMHVENRLDQLDTLLERPRNWVNGVTAKLMAPLVKVAAPLLTVAAKVKAKLPKLPEKKKEEHQEVQAKRPEMSPELELLGRIFSKLWRLVRPPLVTAAVLYIYVFLTFTRINQSVSVASIKGAVKVSAQGGGGQAHAGDTYAAADGPAFVTDADSTATLEMAGSRILLGPNSTLAVKQIEYDSGRIRKLILQKGQMTVNVEPLSGRNARYVIDAGDGHVEVHGTEFQVAASETSLHIGVLSGTVRVQEGASARSVGTGQQTETGKNGRLIVPTTLNAVAQQALEQQANGLKGSGVLDTLGGMHVGFQETFVVPIMELLHLKSTSGIEEADKQAIQSAKTALDTLGQTIAAKEEAPSTLNLSTLAELRMDTAKAQQYLSAFASGKLVAYLHNPSGGYELYARAQDSHHTLLHTTGGEVATTLPDDEERELDFLARKLDQAPRVHTKPGGQKKPGT